MAYRPWCCARCGVHAALLGQGDCLLGPQAIALRVPDHAHPLRASPLDALGGTLPKSYPAAGTCGQGVAGVPENHKLRGIRLPLGEWAQVLH